MKKKEKPEPKKRGRKTNKEREAILAAQQQAAEVSEKEALEAAEPEHNDVVETELEPEEEKQEEPKKPYVTLRELLTDFDDIDRERCRNQAKALWEMYYGGDLYCQTLAIPFQGGGVFKKKVLYSHKSHLAV